MDVATEEFSDVKVPAIKLRFYVHAFFACCLQEHVDEKRATTKLLDQHVSRHFADLHLLAVGHLLDEQRRFDSFQLHEVQVFKRVDIALGVAYGFKNLPPQTCQNVTNGASSKYAQDFSAQRHCSVQVLGQLCSVEHDEWSAALFGHALWRTKAKAHQLSIVLAETKFVVSLDQCFDPLLILHACASDNVPQCQRRVKSRRVVFAKGEVLLQKRIEKLDRCAYRRRVVPRELEVDRNDFALLIEDPVVRLPQQFRHARCRLHQSQHTATWAFIRRVRHDALELGRAPDKLRRIHL